MPTIEGLLSSECNSTSLVQPIDVVFFKCLVDDLATNHIQENLDHYIQENFSA